MIYKKFNNQSECRDFIFEELQKELIGPHENIFHPPGKDWNNRTPSASINYQDQDQHRQEVLSQSPKFNYIAGVLYPKKSEKVEIVDESENVEEEQDDINQDEHLDINKSNDSVENKDDEELTSDNENIIDLTNEMQPSAMGLSFCVKDLFDFNIEIKNIGQYFKIGTRETVPDEARIVAYFVSKYAKDNYSYNLISNNFKLENSNRKTCEFFLANTFKVKENTFKNLVDYFDKYGEHREGWKNSTVKKNDKIYENLNNLDISSFQSKVFELINNETASEKIQIKYDGYFRKKINSKITFTKKELAENLNKSISKKFTLLNGEEIKLSANVKVRKNNFDNLFYVTSSIINISDNNDGAISIDNYFFQSNFTISPSNKGDFFQEYHEKKLKHLDEEEKSINLLHRNKKSFAIGHGCSSNWSLNKIGQCIELFSEIFPTYEIKPIIPQQFNDLDLDMVKFSTDIEYTILQLTNLIKKYEEWLVQEKKASEELKDYFKETSNNNINKAEKSLLRIKEGIKILKSDEKVQSAFKFMNKAIAHQQWHYDFSTNKKDKKNIDFKSINYQKELSKLGKGKWYPFQIAFILLNIKSFQDPHSEDRNIVDLIWFPTGGGKTEAYLGLSAFVIFLRKLNNKNSSGVCVVMRYTLRLLTTQQFQRASALICACEKIRCENENLLGDKKIIIGLWIGGDTTPNKEAEAKIKLENMQRGRSFQNDFLLLSCPWCGEEMGGKEAKGYRVESRRFTFVCPDQNCFFSKAHLPVYLIDETIYKLSPDLLIGTVDKFASLPWKHEAIECFENNGDKLSPDLIVQDELHLISGPLGSVSGMYEILIDSIFEKNLNNRLVKCKIIASTATISRSEKQIRSLYARKSSLFPPQTNQIENNFFAIEDKESEGRKYVGLFCSSSTSPQITMSKIVSSILISGKILEKNTDKARIFDPYWTQLIYFNSIRELMAGATLINDDVQDYKQGIYSKKGFQLFDKSYYRNIIFDELTSRVQSSDIPKILSKLFIEKDDSKKNYPLDICIATNMIQVGIDIQRLSLMVINGQPKTTSEYIQASSRVGRKGGNPGVVFVILSPFRARDRSHYEHFISYHQSIYNFVEPTSVTSHSDAVRKRALHAVVIGLSRLWGGKELRLSPNPIPNKQLREKIEQCIVNYASIADPDHLDELEKTKKDIKLIFDKWERINPNNYGSMDPSQKSKDILMYPSGNEKISDIQPFETLTSMRNVDLECNAQILTDFRGVRT